jgi:pimeloyl-ACP methyl ester carboxylesterase
MKMTSFYPFRSEKAKQQYLELYDKKAERWPVPSETKMINTSYGQTFIRVSGPESARPLVLLFGATGNSLSWLPNIKALSANFHTYAIDNIYDYGRSINSRPLKSSTDYINWLDELFQAIGLNEKLNLVGYSYGGWLTAQYAMSFPHKLNKIVLLAPGGTVLPVTLKFRVRSKLSELPWRYFTRSFRFWIFADLIKKNDVVRKSVEKSIDESFLIQKCFVKRPLVDLSVFNDNQLRNLNVPALFLVGENEKVYSAQKAIQRLNKVASQIKTETIPNAGHDLVIAQAEMVNTKIVEFLGS